MLPEVPQYPYTGPLLKKIAPGAAASSSVAVDTTIKGPSPVIVPSFASWFHLEQIHEIERACLPECFVETSQTASQKSRKVYTEMRNFIIQTFRQNPRIYLSLTAVRKLLTGDATTLQRVHSFLESWGLINFHVDPGSLPTMASPGNFNSSYPLLQHSAYTGFTPLIQTRQSPDVLQHLIHHQAHRQYTNYACASVSAQNSSSSVFILVSPLSAGGNQFLRRSVLLGASSHLSSSPLQTEFALRRDPTAMMVCKVCSSPSVEQVRYVARQKREWVLCAECFFAGKYPHLLSSADFERYLADSDANATDAERSGEWSREEMFRLLQGISMHSDDWESVADHVRTRSKDECCIKFVQMPIEEPFLEQYYNTLTPNQPGLPSASVLPDPSSAAANGNSIAHVPFCDAPNPLLSTISFLCSHVSPSVAAAGASAALTYVAVGDMHGKEVNTPFGAGRIVIGGRESSSVAGAPHVAPSANSLPFESSSFTRPDGILTIDLPWARLYAHASQVHIAKEHDAASAGAGASSSSSSKKDSKQSSKDRAPEKEPIWTKDLVSLSNHVLQASARKAVELAEEEERKVLRFVAQLTGALMKRVESKLAHLDELEGWMQQHKGLYDASANSYYAERLKQEAEAKKIAAEEAPLQEAAPKLGMLPPTINTDPFRQY